MKKAFIVDGLRTPFVKAGKEFSNIHPCRLASHNIKQLLAKMEWRGEEVDELIMGNSFVLPDSANIARVAALHAGLPKEISATTVSRNCASSLESLQSGSAKIQAGHLNCLIVGGVESMSYLPFLLSQKLSLSIKNFMLSRGWRQKIKSLLPIRRSWLKLDFPVTEGLKDPFTGLSMGDTAEILAKEFGISREAQDEFAGLSHQKACAGEERLQEELFPFFTSSSAVLKDTGPRRISKQRLARFRPFFDKKYGTVSIANSCPINDGSSALILMSEKRMSSLGLSPLAEIISSCFVGLEPERMGLGPVYASAGALKRAGLSLKDMDLVEINEAFAAQVLACLKAFASKSFGQNKLLLKEALGEIDPEKLNVNGGAIAIGHPIAATATRIVLSLAKELRRRGVRFGLAGLCVGGGQGGAVILRNPQATN